MHNYRFYQNNNNKLPYKELTPDEILERVYHLGQSHPTDIGLRIITQTQIDAQYEQYKHIEQIARETNEPILLMKEIRGTSTYQFYGDPLGDGQFEWQTYQPDTPPLKTAFKKIFEPIKTKEATLTKLKLKHDSNHILHPILNHYEIIKAEKRVGKTYTQFRLLDGNYHWKTYECDPALAHLVDLLLKAKVNAKLNKKVNAKLNKNEESIEEIFENIVSKNVKIEKIQSDEIDEIIFVSDPKLSPTVIAQLKKAHHAFSYPEYQKLKEEVGIANAKLIASTYNQIYKHSNIFPRDITVDKKNKIQVQEKLEDCINYESTFATILEKIITTDFVIRGYAPTITINKGKINEKQKELTNAIYDIYTICKSDGKITLSNGETISSNAAEKLSYILNLAKHKTDEFSVFHLFRGKSTQEFYQTLDQCIVFDNQEFESNMAKKLSIKPK